MKLAAILITILLFHIPWEISAQGDHPSPAYSVNVITPGGYLYSGLLIRIVDTGILFYPGSFRDWARGIRYKSFILPCTRMQEISMCKKGFLRRIFRKKFRINSDPKKFVQYRNKMLQSNSRI